MENGDFSEIREILRNVGIIQDQAAKVLLQHSEMLAEHDRRLAEHDDRMAEHDERMDRLARHLEVLATITDELIRNKADRKKR